MPHPPDFRTRRSQGLNLEPQGLSAHRVFPKQFSHGNRHPPGSPSSCFTMLLEGNIMDQLHARLCNHTQAHPGALVTSPHHQSSNLNTKELILFTPGTHLAGTHLAAHANEQHPLHPARLQGSQDLKVWRQYRLHASSSQDLLNRPGDHGLGCEPNKEADTRQEQAKTLSESLQTDRTTRLLFVLSEIPDKNDLKLFPELIPLTKLLEQGILCSLQNVT
eukprot:1148771-Pelagomonas_calceolata.AAC.4